MVEKLSTSPRPTQAFDALAWGESFDAPYWARRWSFTSEPIFQRRISEGKTTTKREMIKIATT